MKSTNLKRFGAAALSGAMALSMAAPAFAADNETVITSTYEDIELNVTVPATATASINPYGLPVDLKGTDNTVYATISGEQITNGAPLLILNKSSVALGVSATVSGEPTGVNLVSSLSGEGVTAGEKNVVARFEAFAAPGIEGTATEIGDLAETQAIAYAALKSEDALLTAPVLEAGNEGGQATTGTLVLREGLVAEDDADTAVQDGGAAYIRLSGEVEKKPTTDNAWATTDKFVTTIAFTFEPAEYVGTVALAGNDSVAVGSTAKLTVSGLPANVKVKYDTIKVTSSKETYVTAVNSTKAPTAPDTDVEASAVTLTVTGVKTSSTKSLITVEFEGTDGILYRGTMEVKCA